MALESDLRASNGFLSALTADDFELIRPHLKPADLPAGAVLVGAGETLRRAYLPHRGVISLIVNLSRGEHVQVAMIGRDSIFGVFSSLADPVALNAAVVLVPGVASTIELGLLHAAADRSATLRALMMRHGLAIYAQIQQTAGCNATHSVEARLARCLLQIHDLWGSGKFVLTQQAIAQMIGARRNSISQVASALQQADVIHYSRGHVELRKIDELKTSACECYGLARAQYERLLLPPSRKAARGRTAAPTSRNTPRS